MAAGTYKVRQVLPVGWSQTTPSNGFGINVTLTTNNRVINGSANFLSFNITLSNGTFAGSVKVPGTTRTNAFKGALLQDGNAGYGWFLGTDESGSVSLLPQ